jgi:hypothetical protein
MSIGSNELDALGLGLVEISADGVELVLLEEAAPDLEAERLEKGEDHPAADEEEVRGAEEVADDPQLVGDLRPAEHDGIRALGVLGEPLEHVGPLPRPAPTDHAGEESRDVVDRRLLGGARRRTRRRRRHRPRAASCSANAPAARPRPCSFPPIEPEVFQEDDVAGIGPVDRRGGRLTHGVGGEGDRMVEQLAEPLATGASEYLSSGAPLGRPRWAHTTTTGTGLGESVDRRDRTP